MFTTTHFLHFIIFHLYQLYYDRGYCSVVDNTCLFLQSWCAPVASHRRYSAVPRQVSRTSPYSRNRVSNLRAFECHFPVTCMVPECLEVVTTCCPAPEHASIFAFCSQLILLVKVSVESFEIENYIFWSFNIWIC